MKLITADQVRSLLNYDPETGIFVWRERECAKKTWVTRYCGKQAGGLNVYGYLVISLCGQTAPSHRLAWLYVHGKWPDHEIDHINGVKTDNRIINLRDVPHRVNSQNARQPNKNNKSGLLGVSWRKAERKWSAQLTINGKTTHIGRFDDKHEAHRAYIDAKRKLHGGCTI